MRCIQILDGGLGTTLEDQYGVVFDHSRPLWSSHLIVEDRDTLLSCQRDFAEARADVLLTATYQISIEGFAGTKTPEFSSGIPRAAIGPYLCAAVDIAEKAKIYANTTLALSLGPYGACMVPGQEYSGKYDEGHNSEEALYLWHLERLRLFTDVEGLIGRVQIVAFETIPRTDEIRAVRRAILTAGITTPFWISCVFPQDDESLPDGSSISQVIDAMLKPMADAEGATPWGIGINCTKIHKLSSLIRGYESSVKDMVSAGRIQNPPSLVLYPDGTNGEVYNTVTKRWEIAHENNNIQRSVRSTSSSHPLLANVAYTSWAAQLADITREALGRDIFESYLIGGCCKTSAVQIKTLREAVSDLQDSIT